jgi:23S rRNA (guanosine2251-2'-O)-methyltransferase
MGKKDNTLRVGFHSIESILNNNPHKIKKVTLPANRNDQRISSLILALEQNSIKYDLSSKLKQEPEATISNEHELNFKDFKNFLSSGITNPLILILDNIIDPRNLGACIRSAAVIGVDALIVNKHHCAPINSVAHKVSVGGVEVIKIFYVTNLINSLKFLKENDIDV